MTLHVRASLAALACLVGGCADDKDPQATSPTCSTATTDDPTDDPTDGLTGGLTSLTSTGDDPTGGFPRWRYVSAT